METIELTKTESKYLNVLISMKREMEKNPNFRMNPFLKNNKISTSCATILKANKIVGKVNGSWAWCGINPNIHMVRKLLKDINNYAKSIYDKKKNTAKGAVKPIPIEKEEAPQRLKPLNMESIYSKQGEKVEKKSIESINNSHQTNMKSFEFRLFGRSVFKILKSA